MGRSLAVLAFLGLACASLPASAQSTAQTQSIPLKGKPYSSLEERRQRFFNHVDQFGSGADYVPPQPGNPFPLGPTGLPTSNNWRAINR